MNQHQLLAVGYLREENRFFENNSVDAGCGFNDDQRRRLAVKAKGLGRKLLGQLQN
jgi:hypothetical protein